MNKAELIAITELQPEEFDERITQLSDEELDELEKTVESLMNDKFIRIQKFIRERD